MLTLCIVWCDKWFSGFDLFVTPYPPIHPLQPEDPRAGQGPRRVPVGRREKIVGILTDREKTPTPPRSSSLSWIWSVFCRLLTDEKWTSRIEERPFAGMETPKMRKFDPKPLNLLFFNLPHKIASSPSVSVMSRWWGNPALVGKLVDIWDYAVISGGGCRQCDQIWQNLCQFDKVLKSLWQVFEDYFSIWKHFEPTLENIVC